ncbi:ABC transporter permease [Salinarimonas rosea]|uniref:ABC transporter permease n=1 Tax=Salinarimonas rosea TaxID=552063 RepID=UPI0003F568F9|nr:ABC transporter permease [Salinarimonas rosea]
MATAAPATARRRPPTVLLVAGGFLAATVLVALAAPLVAPYDPLAQSVMARLRGPGAAHLLGTDQFGRDLLSRILYGLRASLAISFGAVGLALLVGGTLGLISAYYRGWTERIVMRVMDVLFAFPVMLLAIGIIAVLGPGATTTAAAIAIVYTPIFARLLRGPALVVATSDYVLSARSIGASDARIIALHILPNLASVVLVQMSLLMSTAILVEASLSFLGLGTQPPTPSLGMMLSEGRNFLLLSPWSAVFSGLAILFVAFVLNFFGDVLRDQLDPRLR